MMMKRLFRDFTYQELWMPGVARANPDRAGSTGHRPGPWHRDRPVTGPVSQGPGSGPCGPSHGVTSYPVSETESESASDRSHAFELAGRPNCGPGHGDRNWLIVGCPDDAMMLDSAQHGQALSHALARSRPVPA